MSHVRYKKAYDVYSFGTTEDDEGCTTASYSQTGTEILACIQPKSKNLAVSPIGSRIGATLIGYTDLSTQIAEKDGVGFENASSPDYYVSAVDVYRTHKTFELTRIG